MRAHSTPRVLAGRATRSPFTALLFGVFLTLTMRPVCAQMFRCVGADGTPIYSDRACDPPRSTETPAPTPPKNPSMTAPVDTSAHPLNPREKAASHLLDLLRIAPVEPEDLQINRTVDEAAPDLVKAIDPDNAQWNPANGRWHLVSEFVKADLHRDAQSALRSSTARASQTSASYYASRASDADMAALSTYLNSAEGARYIAFQNEIRPLLYETMSSILAQEPMDESTPTEQALAERRQLLHLALEYGITKNGGVTASPALQPGSDTVLENAARREGATLDTMYSEYGPSLPAIQSFADSALGKRFFVAVEPAWRSQMALSSAVTTDFAEQEFDKYLQRWRGFYGPMRVTTRSYVMILGRVVTITNTTASRIVSGTQSPEAMAIQCEQRETSQFQRTHRLTDNNARTAALKDIQNRCRAEQRLPPL